MAATGKILLIDGDAPRRQALTQGVENAGYRVEPAPDYGQVRLDAGKKAAAVVCAAAPGLNEALAFCAELRQGTAESSPPLVVYAAEMEEILRLRFLEAGADRVVSAEELIPALAECVPPGKSGGGRRSGKSGGGVGAETTIKEGTSSQMFFRLDHGELANALQFLSTTKRTGELRIETRGRKNREVVGRIFLDKGNLLHAQCGEERGTEAMAALLTMEKVEARLYEKEATEQRTLKGTTDHILIQASVLGDELGALRKELPPGVVLAHVAEDANVSGLEAEAAKVFRAIDGARSIREVFAEAGVTEGRGLMLLKSLLELGLVQKVPAAEAAENRLRNQLRARCRQIEELFDQSPEDRTRLLEALGKLVQRFSSRS
ncbi:MAG: response regulator [Kiritimatiellaeota bacterium]|nr:response regulator [Kiritimatiellota bacterium]